MKISDIILLLSGSNDQTKVIASNLGAKVFCYSSGELKHKLRVFGAQQAKGKFLLFIDAGSVIKADALMPFVQKVQTRELDLALSNFRSSPKPGVFSIEMVEYVLNFVANRRDLKCASLYNPPFAISRKALTLIGEEALAIPPLAKFSSILNGLAIETLNFQDNNSNETVDSQLLMEECLQAMDMWLQSKGIRSGYTNLGRKYELIKLESNQVPSFYSGVTAIISASNEEKTIGEVITNAFGAGADQVVVIENGSTDDTSQRARAAGAKVISFSSRLGHDVGRAIGALYYPSQCMLFLDGDMVITSNELKSLINAVTRNDIDIALNDLSRLLRFNKRWDEVTWSKYFLNHALIRSDCDVNNLTAVPHAISGRALKAIGPECLAIPPLAMVRAALAGLNIKAVREIDVISINRVRKELHQSEKGNLLEQLILGDMCQAIYELILSKNGRVQK